MPEGLAEPSVETVAKIKELEAGLEQASSIIAQQQRQVASLTSARDDLTMQSQSELQRMREELSSCRAIISRGELERKKFVEQSEADRRVQEELRLQLHTTTEQFKEELQAAKLLLNNGNNDSGQQSSSMIQQLQDEKKELLDKIHYLTALRQSSDATKDEIVAQLYEELSALQANYSQQGSFTSKLQGEVVSLTTELSQRTKDLHKSMSELQTLQAKQYELMEVIHSLQNMIKLQEIKEADVRNQLKYVEAQCKTRESQYEELTLQLSENEKAITMMKDMYEKQLNQNRKEMDKMQRHVDEGALALTKKQMEFEGLLRHVNELVASTKSPVKQSRPESAVIEEKIEVTRDVDAQQRWLQSVINLSLHLHEVLSFAYTILQSQKQKQQHSTKQTYPTQQQDAWRQVSVLHHRLHEMLVRPPWSKNSVPPLIPAHEMPQTMLSALDVKKTQKELQNTQISAKESGKHPVMPLAVCKALVKLTLGLYRRHKRLSEASRSVPPHQVLPEYYTAGSSVLPQSQAAYSLSHTSGRDKLKSTNATATMMTSSSFSPSPVRPSSHSVHYNNNNYSSSNNSYTGDESMGAAEDLDISQLSSCSSEDIAVRIDRWIKAIDQFDINSVGIPQKASPSRQPNVMKLEAGDEVRLSGDSDSRDGSNKETFHIHSALTQATLGFNSPPRHSNHSNSPYRSSSNSSKKLRKPAPSPYNNALGAVSTLELNASNSLLDDSIASEYYNLSTDDSSLMLDFEQHNHGSK